MIDDGLRRSCRPPAVAGLFYPAEPARLSSVIEAMLAEADRLRAARTKRGTGRWPKAVIVPHAGYIYSGPIAASAYATWRGAAERVRRVVLVGPAHRAYVAHGLAGPGVSTFATPLGIVPVDEEALAAVPQVWNEPGAHAREHSLEVQLPFIQRVLPHAHIVPLLVSEAGAETVGRAIEALWEGDETVIAVSSDLSHYLPYREARAIDEETAERILALALPIESERACGAAAVNGLLWVARRRGLRPSLLDLRNSGDTSGGRDEVVGYGAFAFDEEGGADAD